MAWFTKNTTSIFQKFIANLGASINEAEARPTSVNVVTTPKVTATNNGNDQKFIADLGTKIHESEVANKKPISVATAPATKSGSAITPSAAALKLKRDRAAAKKIRSRNKGNTKKIRSQNKGNTKKRRPW